MNYRIIPPDGYIEGTVRVPLSKSMSNRALVINALTRGALPLKDVAMCDDTAVMLDALATEGDVTVNIGAAGTAMRFLTAYFATCEGRQVILDGCERMRRRPISPLVDALISLGVGIEYLGERGFPPLRITGKKLSGGTVKLDSTVSSQYVSALLMIAPAMDDGLTILLEGDTISRPYIDMTLKMMGRAGIEYDFSGNVITVSPGRYHPVEHEIEGDWSAASYWYELQSVASGEICIEGIGGGSCQGDSVVARIYEELGVVTSFDKAGARLEASPEFSPRLQLDLADCPDLTPAIVVTCCMAGIPFRLTGLQSLHIKETDRVEALRAEMLKLGVILTEEQVGTLVWEGARRPMTEMPVFDTYGDHRMAMSFAMVSLYIPGIVIKDVEVVTKSYPDFFTQLQSLGFRCLDGDAPLPRDGEEDAE